MKITKQQFYQALNELEGNTPAFQQVFGSLPLDQRPGVRVLQAAFADIKVVSNHLSFKLNSEQCDKVYKFYREQLELLYEDINFKRKFDIKKAIVILGFICPVMTAPTARILYKAVEANEIMVDPTVRALIPIVELLANLLYRRDKIPEVQKTLEEIRDSSVNFILNYLETGNKTIINFSEDILVMMVARKLYNAMYWYMYGKQ